MFKCLRNTFNVSFKRAGGLSFLRIGNLSVSWSVSKTNILDNLRQQYREADHFGPWADKNGDII